MVGTSALLPEQTEKMTLGGDIICSFGSSRDFNTQACEIAYDPGCKAQVGLHFWHVVEDNGRRTSVEALGQCLYVGDCQRGSFVIFVRTNHDDEAPISVAVVLRGEARGAAD
jgi:hypothetical protein